MIAVVRTIAFDADDTLWHNEILYVSAQERLGDLLRRYNRGTGVVDALYETEMGNLEHFGYGIKSFALSMIETAVRLTEGQIDGRDILRIIDLAKEMRHAPVRLLDHVAEVIPTLSQSHTLILITKGDLYEQQPKIARSGLDSYFSTIEVVADKTPEVYLMLLARYEIDPQHFLMVGNSVRSDILPVLSIGAHAVHIPYHVTWAHEILPVQPGEGKGYESLEHIGLLPEFVARLDGLEA